MSREILLGTQELAKNAIVSASIAERCFETVESGDESARDLTSTDTTLAVLGNRTLELNGQRISYTNQLTQIRDVLQEANNVAARNPNRALGMESLATVARHDVGTASAGLTRAIRDSEYVKDDVQTVGETMQRTMSRVYDRLGSRAFSGTILTALGEIREEIGANIRLARAAANDKRAPQDSCLDNMDRAMTDADHDINTCAQHANSLEELASGIEECQPHEHLLGAAALLREVETQLNSSAVPIVELRHFTNIIRSYHEGRLAIGTPDQIRTVIGNALSRTTEALRQIELDDPGAKLQQAATNVGLARVMCAETIVPNLGEIADRAKLGLAATKLVAVRFGVLHNFAGEHLGHIQQL